MRGKLRRRLAFLLTFVMMIPYGFAAPMAAADGGPQTVYHETFKDGIGIVAKSGNPTFQHADEVYFTGNEDGGAMYVTDRSNDWFAADFNFNDIGLKLGNTYSVTATVYLDASEEASGTAAAIMIVPEQVIDDQYNRLWKQLPIQPGEAVTLTQTFTIEDNDRGIRIQTTDTASFYIGDIRIELIAEGGDDPGSGPESKVVLYQGFEDDDYSGWSRKSWGHASGDFSITTETAAEGDKSLKFANRQDPESQPLLYLTNILEKGHVYDISLQVKLGEGSENFHIASVINAASLSNQYPWLVGNLAVTDEAWTLFEAKGVEIPQDTTNVVIYIEPAEGNTLTSDIYIDEVLIVDVTPDDEEEEPGDLDQSGITDDFESDIGNWARRFGSGGIEVTDEDNHSEGGSYSLKTTASAQYDGPILDVLGKMHRGHQYELSAWVKMTQGEQPTVLRISVQYGDSSFANVSANVLVTDQAWVKISGLYTQTTRPGNVLNAYVEVANDYGEARTFLIDDFELKYIGPVAGPNPDFSLQSIQDVYEDDFLIGNIMNPGNFDDDIRLQMLQKHYTLLTPENLLKPEYAYKQGTRVFDLTDEIALVEAAIENGFNVHGHVLVWHSQSPDWLHTQLNENGTPLRDEEGNIKYLDEEEALENLRTHIRTVVQEIGDRVISWDVVNEAMNDNPSDPENWKQALRESGWLHAIGPDYIYEAYKTARKVIDDNGWDIELYYNDYNDDNQNKSRAIAAMVKELNERYAEEKGSDKKLIDGIGMQAHYNVNTNPENVRASLERFIGLGVKVGITELDVMAGAEGVITEEQAIRQGWLYAQLFELYKKYAEHITRVTFWGVDDGTSWRSENAPLLFDSRFQAKPAYYAVIDPEGFMKNNNPPAKEHLAGIAAYGTPVVDGTEDEVWSRAEELPIARYQTAHNGATGTARVLWDDRNLYVLIKVQDTELDHAHREPHEQDSIEVFLDEQNRKSPSYGPGIGQYRVNYQNARTFNPESIADGFESEVVVDGTNYTVEVKIPFKTITPANGRKIGFDAQINDAKNGARQSVATWNDLTGVAYQDPSVFGALTLTGKPGSTWAPWAPPASGPTVSEDGTVTVKPTVENGRAKASLSSDTLAQALESAGADDGGSKTVVLEIGEVEAEALDVELPAAVLAEDEAYVIQLKTPQGVIDLPSNMLEGIAGDAESVTISIAPVDVEALDDTVRSAIGGRPAISLNVLADGEAIAWNNPNTPVTVSIPYEPTEEELANPDLIVVWYIDGEGNVMVVPNGRYDAESGSVVFSTTHFSTYAVVYAETTFHDIVNMTWAKQAIEAMASRDVIPGARGDDFNPYGTVSRAEFAAMLVRLLELQGAGGAADLFGDVAETHDFHAELAIAKQLGIVRGNAEGRFRPDAPVTRQDMMVMVDRALAAAGRPLLSGGSLSGFSDAADVAGYAASSAEKMIAAGIVKGISGKLAPGSHLTRAEAAVILHRIWSR